MKKTGAQIIVECLLEQGVDTVFGYPGGAVLNIYDALYEYSDKIRHVLTAHEQGASHAADGYARTTGKTGVVIATSGPGATNLVTGIATAYMDSVPMVAITGNVAVDLLGRDSFQEVDITGITMPITKHNFVVKRVEDLANTIREAFRIAVSKRPGPVLIDVPKDITAAVTEYTPAERPPASLPAMKEEAVQNAVQMLKEAKRPLIYAGGGVISSGSTEELIQLAEKLQAPVCCSVMGLGGFPADHRLFAGMIGMHGTYAANKATQEADLLLVAGARFSDRVAGDRKQFASQAKILHLDIDPAEIDKNVHTAYSLVGDLKQLLGGLSQRIPEERHDAWLKEMENWKAGHPVPPQDNGEYPDPMAIIDAVRARTCDDDIMVTDVGQHQMWVAQRYRFNRPRTFATSGGLGTMGYGLGAAIGAKVANPGRKVVLFTGDGSFHMNLNELTTLASYELPVVVMVMNNSVLGMVRQWQKLFYGYRFSQTDPHRKTDLVKLAEAFGVTGLRITKPEEVETVVEKALALGKPVVVDCRISPDCNALPMIPPGASADAIMMTMPDPTV